MTLYTIGEALIDFMPYNEGFFPVVGGAPANVAACYAKLGGKSYFIGKVGEDMFGEKIIATLSNAKVNNDYISKTKKANTALSFVTLKENGEREFAFYRNPSADMFLDIEDIKDISFRESDILHFCSVDLIDMPVKKATEEVINKVKKAGGIISFDPNIRKNLWEDHIRYKKTITEFLPKADIIKISEDECDFIFSSTDIEKIAQSLLKTSKIVIITLGDKGSHCYTNHCTYRQKAYKINSVDTTGAGDSFIGAFLRYLDLQNLESIKIALKKASATSAIVCTKKGVLDSLPDNDQLKLFLEQNE